MIKKFIRYLYFLKKIQLVNMALSRGAASSGIRNIEPTVPESWEFSGFSQNGEDGIIDFLLNNLKTKNRYFIEIGASDGLENNTSWLAMTKRYSGMWIEGKQENSDWSEYLLGPLNYGVENVCMFIARNNILDLKNRALYSDPDLFSLDIDGNDYYIVEEILKSGFKPKIFVVEYNAVFGPEQKVSIPYDETFTIKSGSHDNLYYGCSISALRNLFESFGYYFVTVESNGVNAFFVDPGLFDQEFLNNIKGIQYRENFSNIREYKKSWEEQFQLIKNRKYTYF